MISGNFNSQSLYSEHRGVSDRGDSNHVANGKGDTATLSAFATLSMPSPSTSRSSSLSSSSALLDQSPSSSNLTTMEPNCLCDHDQYPAPHTFESIVQDYLQKLSIKKRDKALVNQERYAVILKVLKDPRNTSIGTAQFRFWVKKMFELSATSTMNHGGQQSRASSTWVVCHHGKPVAVQEQIYDILIQAHREAHHGGRDKTSALVRKHYSWVPKELTARFVQHCPFCISRRNGHPGRPSCNQTLLVPSPISAPTTTSSNLTFIKQEVPQDSISATSSKNDNHHYQHHQRSSHLDYYNHSMTALSLKPDTMNYSCHQHQHQQQQQHDEPIIAPSTPTDATSIATTAAASAVSTQWMEPGVPVYYYAKPSSHDIFSSAVAMDLHSHDTSASLEPCAYSSFFINQQISSVNSHHHNHQHHHYNNRSSNNENTMIPPASTMDSIISQCQQETATSTLFQTKSNLSWSLMAPLASTTE